MLCDTRYASCCGHLFTPLDNTYFEAFSLDQYKRHVLVKTARGQSQRATRHYLLLDLGRLERVDTNKGREQEPADDEEKDGVDDHLQPVCAVRAHRR